MYDVILTLSENYQGGPERERETHLPKDAVTVTVIQTRTTYDCMMILFIKSSKSDDQNIEIRHVHCTKESTRAQPTHTLRDRRENKVRKIKIQCGREVDQSVPLKLARCYPNERQVGGSRLCLLVQRERQLLYRWLLLIVPAKVRRRKCTALQ